MDNYTTDVIMIGASILDIPAGPVDQSVFETGSHPVEQIQIHTGGDALNESIILARLGKKVHLISRIGDDSAGKFILSRCEAEGIDLSGIRQIPGLDTGINLVLVGADGERSFITASGGSLRKQQPCDVNLATAPKGKILMLASIFVYPYFTVSEMERIFKEAKAAGYLVCADMTKRKQKESLADMAPALRYVDVIFPNLEEAALVSGLSEPEAIAAAFLEAGVGNIVLKLGSKGCLIKTNPKKKMECSWYRPGQNVKTDTQNGTSPEAASGVENARTPDTWSIPAVPGIKAVDTTGAGDTFAAAFLCGLLENKSLEECGRFANAAASVTVEAFGATTALTERSQVDQRTGY